MHQLLRAHELGLVEQTDISMDSTIYHRLDQSKKEFRLLKLKPGSRQQIVQCSMHSAFLTGPTLPEYETISYVWGSSNLDGRIYVNGNKLDVPISAERVLRQMRAESEQRTLWLDAICINQNDTADRNYQVRLMSDIYSKSASGLIWLGEDDGTAGETLHTLEALHNEAQRETDDFRTFKEAVWPGWWDTYGPRTLAKYDPECVARFFERPWFARLWYAVI